MAETDYTTACGSAPLSFWQMLASTIFGYQDIAGVTHYRLNTLQQTDACSELSALLDCDTSHIEPERQLVENLFALDDCLLLALKIFSNSDRGWSDYEECGEVPLTFFQMLARCIVVYSDVARLNSVIASAACTELTQLLDCSVNNVEAERLLVANLFAVDSCGNMLIKLITDTSTMTDFSSSCTQNPQTLYQLLARCIVSYGGTYYLNLASVTGYCDSLLAFWTCNNGYITPERALAENIFATDNCGNLAVKIFNNQGEAQQ